MNFFDKIKEGYEEEENKRKKEEKDKIKKGIVSGTVEGTFNPIRWIGSLLS